MNIGCRYLFELVLSFSLDKYPEVELLSRMAYLFLFFGGISIVFSIGTVPAGSPTNSAVRLDQVITLNTIYIFPTLTV